MKTAWESLRILLVIALTRKYASKLGKGKSKAVAAFILSVLSHKVLQQALDKILKVVFGYDALNVMDTYFQIDKPLTHCNSIAICRFERFDAQRMKQFLKTTFTDIMPRSKHKLVQMFGRWYFAPLT